MAELKEARVPDIGNYDGVPVIELLVAVGDTVKQDQGLVTLESDKATMEVPAPFAGVVRELKVKVGDKLAEGSVVALIEASDGAAAPAPAKADTPRSAAGQHRYRRDCDPGRTGRRGAAGRQDRAEGDRSGGSGRARQQARDRPGSRTAEALNPDVATGGIHRRRTDAGQGPLRQPRRAPVRARARRGPGQRAGQRTRRPHQQGRRAEVREVGAGRRRRRCAGRRGRAAVAGSTCCRGRRSTSPSSAKSKPANSRASRRSPGPTWRATGR